MKNGGSGIRCVLFTAGTFFAFWLAAVAYARIIAPGVGQVLSQERVELTRQEVRRLSQLHGTNVIKIERGTVSILRDGRWIPVATDQRG